MPPFFDAISSFRRSLWAAKPQLSRIAFEDWQSRAVARWLQTDVPNVPAFDGVERVSDLPIMDKASLMASFASYNRAEITADQVQQAMQSTCRVDDYTVGASTGTSGNRGLFVISDAERFRWLGAILAKAMPDLLWRRRKVAILLPQSTPLYDTARTGRWIDLRFFALSEGLEAWRDTLAEWNPDVIVAPPKVLRYLAESDVRISPMRVFSAAETLDPMDRPIIEDWLGSRLEQIYMASEGLLGVTCRHGVLHLAEDSMLFEFEPVGQGLVSPLISSFRRDVQIMARYRMNDLLRLSDVPCPCGSVLQRVDEVVGRMDDCFWLPKCEGHAMITPDVLRNAVLDADPSLQDFRIIQKARAQVDLVLPTSVPSEAATRIKAGLETILNRQNAQCSVKLLQQDLPLDVGRKLRRVENQFGTGQ